MGYTHYWTYRPDHPRYLQAWPAVVDAAGRIIARVRRGGITLAGPHGRGLPVLATEQGIRFNGDATAGLDCESLVLDPPATGTAMASSVSTFCKTNRLPYDVAVAGLLLFCQHLLPEVFAIASDGAWHAEWANGAAFWWADAPASKLSARAVVADLFGMKPQASPLRTSLSGSR